MTVLKFNIFLAFVALVMARRPPNAEYVKELLKSNPQLRISSDIEEDSMLVVPDLIQKYGYPQETHTVITSDGYILEMHRIPHGRDNYNTPGSRPAVFIMHGLLSSSADFVVLGPGNALAYVLAEAGYDVWLGNARGNFYSRRHVTLDPDSRWNQAFWRFSWDEIGNHDLPAFIDYILALTGQEKLHYIGHSQGGTTFLVLNSLRPEYSSKFISFNGLAPASFFENNEVSMFRSLAPLENVIETSAFALGYGEVFNNYEFVTDFKKNYCETESILSLICDISLTGSNGSINSTMMPLIKSHAPAGASIRQFAHYGQVIRFGAFRRYNYNTLTNLSVYGTSTPPEYNLSRVNVPAYIYYGLSDNEVNYRDIFLLASKLPRIQELIEADRKTFDHFDFLWATDVKNIVYDKLVTRLRVAEDKI